MAGTPKKPSGAALAVADKLRAFAMRGFDLRIENEESAQKLVWLAEGERDFAKDTPELHARVAKTLLDRFKSAQRINVGAVNAVMAKAIVDHIVGRFLGKVTDVRLRPLKASTKARKAALGQPTTPGIAEGDLLADVKGGTVLLGAARGSSGDVTWDRNNQDPSDEYPVGRGTRRVSEYDTRLKERPYEEPRTLDEAQQIARMAGVTWDEEEFEFRSVPSLGNAFGSYPIQVRTGPGESTELSDWTVEPLRPGGPRRIVVTLPETTLRNPLTIAAAIHHEITESRAMRKAFEGNGGYLTGENAAAELARQHSAAWASADELVERLQPDLAGTGPTAQFEARRRAAAAARKRARDEEE